MAAIFALIGIILSVAVNAVVLRAAFRPLTELREVAQSIREGEVTVRASETSSSVRELRELAITLNSTLDELAQDRAELRSLSTKVIQAQEEERRRISRELHDETAQLLFAQLLQVTALQAEQDDTVRRLGRTLEQSTVEALEGVRRLALELRPPALDDLGLSDALAGLAQRFEAQTGITADYERRGGRGRLHADIELVLYRIAQEALSNVAKHAEANTVTIDLDQRPTEVSLSVRDDGRGFRSDVVFARADTGVGMGLFGMQERASLAGGTLRIWSRAGLGTEVFAFIPLRDPTLNGAIPTE